MLILDVSPPTRHIGCFTTISGKQMLWGLECSHLFLWSLHFLAQSILFITVTLCYNTALKRNMSVVDTLLLRHKVQFKAYCSSVWHNKSPYNSPYNTLTHLYFPMCLEYTLYWQYCVPSSLPVLPTQGKEFAGKMDNHANIIEMELWAY